MSVLSKRTKNLVHALYKTPEAAEVCDLLESECGTESLSCDGGTPDQMERIRFGVLKLAQENTLDLNVAIRLAQTDWRDVLMSAGFSLDLNAHENWANRVSY